MSKEPTYTEESIDKELSLKELSLEEGVVDKNRSKQSIVSSIYGRVVDHFGETLMKKRSDLLLLICCFISGLTDSGIFNTWSCFVNMQTGNTIFLALGSSGQPINKPYGWLRSLMAIVSFVIGCISFGLANRIGRTRLLLSGSFTAQAICLIIAAILVQTKVVPENPDSFKVLVPIVFVGFQAGGQVVMSNFLGFPEIPTTVLTSVYSGLATDPNISMAFHNNPKRNRKIAALVALSLGAIIGGFLTKLDHQGLASIFWIAAALKFAIAGSLSIWKKEQNIDPVLT